MKLDIFEQIVFLPGRITYTDFSSDLIQYLLGGHIIDEKDLLQVEYPASILIDVGWLQVYLLFL